MKNKGKKFKLSHVHPLVEPIDVIFIGTQEWGELIDLEPLVLFNLTSTVKNHPADSTLSRNTLEEYGYIFPHDAP